jgi:Tfp pilus assembly protein PilN
VKSIQANFYFSQPWRRHLPGQILFALGFVALVWASFIAWKAYAELDRWQQDLYVLKNQKNDKKIDPNADDQHGIKAELQAAQQVIDQLNVPWAVLFNALESGYSDHAILLAAEPDPQHRKVRLLVEAKDMTAMLDYIRQVRSVGVFADAYIASHQVNQQDSQKPIRFTVQAHWSDVPLPVVSGTADSSSGAGTVPASITVATEPFTKLASQVAASPATPVEKAR